MPDELKFLNSFAYKKGYEIKDPEGNLLFEDMEKSAFSVNILVKKSLYDLILLHHLTTADLTLKEAQKDVDEIKNFIEEMSTMSVLDIIEFLDIYCDMCLEYGDKINSIEKVLNLDDPKLKISQDFLKNSLNTYGEKALQSLWHWLSDLQLVLDIYFAFLIKGTKNKLEQKKLQVDVLKPSTYTKNSIDNFISFIGKNLSGDFITFNNYKSNYENLYEKLKRQNRKKINNLDLLLSDIENKSLTYEKIKKYNLDPDIYNLALLALIKQKNIDYKRTYQTYKLLAGHNFHELEVLFKEQGYNFNLLTEEEKATLTEIDAKNILANLSFIKNSSLSFLQEEDEAFVPILMLSHKDLEKLDRFIAKGELTPKYILKNFAKLNSSSILTLTTNIDLLRGAKVDFKALNNYNDNLLLELNQSLLNTILYYNINLNAKNIRQFAFLENSKLLDIIDNFIEVGLLNQIQKLPNLITSSSKNVIKRIIIMQNLDNSILNEHDTISKKVRDGQNFYLNDTDLDNYVYQNFENFIDQNMANTLKENDNIDILLTLPEELKFIENYKINSYHYLINNKIFSRLKLLRYLNTLINAGFTNYKDMLFNCLIFNYPEYLSLEDINFIKNLKENTKKKQLS